jgi:hypothetical protein
MIKIKNRAKVLIIFVLAILSSCKKEVSAPKSEEKIQEIVQKFNLRKNDINLSSPTIQFETVDKLNNYLAKKEIALQNPNTIAKAHIKQQNQLIVNQTSLEESEITYQINIESAYWDGNNFPQSAVVSFRRINSSNIATGVTSFLIYNGPNFGSWTYTHTIGSAGFIKDRINFNAQGIYSESYGIGGIYTYTKSWNVTISGTAFPNDDVTATISYSGI